MQFHGSISSTHWETMFVVFGVIAHCFMLFIIIAGQKQIWVSTVQKQNCYVLKRGRKNK